MINAITIFAGTAALAGIAALIWLLGKDSRERCPSCFSVGPHRWSKADAQSFDVMTCRCGHESRWMTGPGIRICVDHEL